jgi:hypothetical protein
MTQHGIKPAFYSQQNHLFEAGQEYSASPAYYLHQATINQAYLKQAYQNTTQQFPSAKATRQIHVSNLPDDIEIEDITRIFKDYPLVEKPCLPINQLYNKHLTDLEDWAGDSSHRPEFHFPKYKGFSILTVPNESVMRAILSRSFTFKSKTLLVREFVQDSEDMDKIDLEMCLRRVCIHNISIEISES